MPSDFPFPFSYINYIGMNRLALGIILLLLLGKLIKREPLSLEFPQLKWLLFFFLGVTISYIYNADIRSNELFDSVNSPLTTNAITGGAGLYIIFFYFFSHKNIMEIFFTICIVMAFIFYSLMLLGLSDEFVSFFGSGITYYYNIEDKYDSFIGLLRMSFPTMDDNFFGPLASIFFMLGLYKYLRVIEREKWYNIYLLLFFILTVAVLLQTVSRSTAIVSILQLCVFSLLSAKHKSQLVILSTVSVALLWLFMSAGLVPGYQFIMAFGERFEIIFNNIPRYFEITGYESDLSLYSGSYQIDNYHARILLAIASLPIDLSGWIFGTGGIYAGFVKGLHSGSHIDITNWISQWGLITTIPLCLYLCSMMFYLLRWDETKIRVQISTTEKHDLFLIRNLGISLLLGFLILWLCSPLFYLFWFIQGLTASIIILLRKYEKPYIA